MALQARNQGKTGAFLKDVDGPKERATSLEHEAGGLPTKWLRVVGIHPGVRVPEQARGFLGSHSAL